MNGFVLTIITILVLKRFRKKIIDINVLERLSRIRT